MTEEEKTVSPGGERVQKRCPDWMEDVPEAVEAMNNEGDWEFTPCSIEEMMWMPYYCDEKSCQCWHESWAGYGWEIEKGKVLMTEWTCDSDGDWDCGYATYYTEDPDYCEKGWDRLSEDSIKAEESYLADVKETKEDPLGYWLSEERFQRFLSEDEED